MQILHVTLFVCLYYLSQAVPPPGGGALEGYCIDDKDCKATECCVDFEGLRSTITLTPDLKRFVNGKCEKLGTLNGKCMIPDVITSGLEKRHYHECPCSERLSCKHRGVTVNEGVCKP